MGAHPVVPASSLSNPVALLRRRYAVSISNEDAILRYGQAWYNRARLVVQLGIVLSAEKIGEFIDNKHREDLVAKTEKSAIRLLRQADNIATKKSKKR